MFTPSRHPLTGFTGVPLPRSVTFPQNGLEEPRSPKRTSTSPAGTAHFLRALGAFESFVWCGWEAQFRVAYDPGAIDT